ncbi:DUF1983 domain-containing protein [Pasteurellaceae bacterium USgator11]|nr:DUF1983 domain-containing protein [Pasteurellaceae bacterium USgator41]TNG95759.1 DUF1983 domain-containing protein [Pasteurellaceae bacterium UScroc12]TNG98817.1 DUF1983 domain-containing protein [Pasteurellaceae bacterium USgator11]TNG99204.1 DUF1983 domain-containing protein [Pasteurellaceae bacterium UScroc31]
MGGSKKGGGHTPWEQPESGRSKQRVKIVEVISEGAIRGLVDGVKSVYLDKTPIQNADNSYNFSNVIAHGVIGSQDQSVMDGFNTSENEVSVGVEVKKTAAITRTINDEKVSRLRFTIGAKGLFQQKDNGDTVETSVDLIITVGDKTYPVNIKGKYSSQYLRQVVIDNLPKTPFLVKVERVTADSKSQRLQNATVWSSYTEIIDAEFAYPNTALAGIMFDSEYFSQNPQRNYEILGIEVLVPSNYDPIARTYSGLWDGTFKIAWTNNPAWIFYDLMTNKRYGMGQRLGEFGCDKWALYAIAQYCDQIVPDGFGGKEPRMTCNCWLTEQRQAHELINDLASVFRAMPVWNGMQLTAIQDRPADPVWTYTNANVSGGFTRTYSALKARHNTIHVEYLDAADFYEKKIEYVSDSALVKRYGLNVRKVTAFGCTSRGQAYRTGRWILETEKLEKETITFAVGREGLMHLPGDIIRVADNHYAGTDIGGRALSVNGKKVTLDREITLSGESFFTYINGEAKHDTIKIVSVAGKVVTLASEPVGLAEFGVWSLSTAVVTSGLYKALSIAEDGDTYTITALQHEPQKEAIVDNGAHFEPRETTLHSAKPAQVTHSDVSAGEDGITLTWEQPTVIGTVTYEVKLYKDGKLYRIFTDLKEPKLTFDGLPDGSYTAEIRAKNQLGQYSNPVTKSFEINLTITDLRTTSELMAINVEWTLPVLATVGNATEIWHAREPDLSKAVKLTTLAYPATSYIKGNVGLSEKHYFWVRLTDKNGNKGGFTEAVFGEADHNPDNLVNYLNGQITQTALGKDLIAQLTGFESGIEGLGNDLAAEIRNRSAQILAETQARSLALLNEATKRSAEVKAAADKAAADLLKEVQERGTVVNELQKVDQQQAQLITQATAKADNALAGIEAEKTARAEGDKAEAKARETLAGRVGKTEADLTEEKRIRIEADEAQATESKKIGARLGTAESTLTKLNETVVNNQRSTATQFSEMNSKFDNLGTVNLLIDSEYKKPVVWKGSDARISDYFSDVYAARVLQAFALKNGIAQVGFVQHLDNAKTQITAGRTYTLAMNAQGTAGFSSSGLNYVYLMREDGGSHKLPTIRLTASIAERPSITFTAPWSSKQCRLLIAANGTYATTDWFAVHSVKLERGSVATDWTPTPADVDSTIVETNAKITTLESAVASANKASATRFDTIEASLGASGNLLQNSEFLYPDSRNVPEGYTLSNANGILAYHNLTNTGWTYALRDQAVFCIRDNRTDAENPTGATNSYATSIARFPVQAGQILQFSCYVAGWGFRPNSGDLLYLDFRGSNGTTGVSKTRIKKGNFRYPNATTIATGKLGRKAASDVYTSTTQFEHFYFNEVIPEGVDFVNIGIAIRSNFGTDCYLFCCLPQLCEVSSLDAPLIPYNPGSSSAKITTLQSAIATSEQATATKITAMQSSIGDATAKITDVQKTVADVSGKLSATRTLKTEAIAGGRTAIAGIAMGATADNKTLESSVIVMANNFGVVKNASDGNVVNMLTVVDNKTALNGDLIARGTITGTQIRAGQTLSSPVINAGTGSFTGAVTATSGSFTGAINATSGTFRGRVEAASGFFSGEIRGASGTFNGRVEAANINGSLTRGFKLTTSNQTIPAEPYARWGVVGSVNVSVMRAQGSGNAITPGRFQFGLYVNNNLIFNPAYTNYSNNDTPFTTESHMFEIPAQQAITIRVTNPTYLLTFKK